MSEEISELDYSRAMFKLGLHERQHGAAEFDMIKSTLMEQIDIRSHMPALDPAFEHVTQYIHILENHLQYKGIVERRPPGDYGYPFKCLYALGPSITEEATVYIPFSYVGSRHGEGISITNAIRRRHPNTPLHAQLEYIVLEAGYDNG